jgi:DNA-binding NtrC family response regulator
MTAFGSIQSAVAAIREGAHGYITKPFDNDELLVTLERALDYERMRAEVRALRRELRTRYGLDRMAGSSPKMRAVLDAIERMARVNATVLVLGESGTGKELAGRLVDNGAPTVLREGRVLARDLSGSASTREVTDPVPSPIEQ